MDVARSTMVVANWIARAAILITLACYIAAWPFLIMAAGATLEHPEHGVRVAVVFTVQTLVALAGVIGAAFLHDRRWFWWVVGTVALWLPIAFLIASIGRQTVR